MGSAVTGQSSGAEHASLLQQIQAPDRRFWIVNIIEMFERLAYCGLGGRRNLHGSAHQAGRAWALAHREGRDLYGLSIR